MRRLTVLGQLSKPCVCLLNLLTCQVRCGDIAEDQHRADDPSGRIANPRAAIGDMQLPSIASDQRSMIRQRNQLAPRDRPMHRYFGRFARLRMTDPKDFSNWTPSRLIV